MRHRSNNSSRGVVNSPETAYARTKTAEWILRVMEQAIPLESCFFTCLEWVIGDLRGILEALMEELGNAPKNIKVRKAVQEALKPASSRYASECEELAEEHPALQNIMRDIATRECARLKLASSGSADIYSLALRRMEKTFGLNADCLNLCEFFFINQSFPAVEDYFEDHLDVYGFGNRRILAHMLGMSSARIRVCIKEMTICGLINGGSGRNLRLQDSLLSFWETQNDDADKLFCRPLEGDALPLSAFRLPQDDVAHVEALLEKKSKAPVHILLYGPPGTGKTTFARSLAQSCGVKAWSVTSRANDDDDERRASLTACLHMAAKHKGAFVLVDEAERLLDTDMHFGRQTKDKAWVNDLLERPGNRVVWITNQVRHIDQAVRRRFSFSVYFEELGLWERTSIWQQILTRHRLKNRLSDEELTLLAENYPASAALINNAVLQAKELYKEKSEFGTAVERILRSHDSLRHNGGKQRAKPRAAADFSLDGVCLEGSAPDLLRRCRRIDAAIRKSASLRPGCATMLFYGPPGTGKTALAHHIARELERECLVQRASDLLSPYVGEAEQNIAWAFRKAEAEGAVLVIDEADSFLYSRSTAQRSWETSLVNEFLTVLEECRVFCICTTNRREELDAAAMRRFSHKVAFAHAGPEQIRALYQRLLAPLCAEPLPPLLETELLGMSRLTPGDFHAVRSQYDSLFADASEVNHKILIDALAKEQSLKTEQRTRRIGFHGGAYVY